MSLPELPKFAEAVMERLERAGYEAYAVGGCVRDPLLGLAPNDWDVTTDARPERVAELFSEPPFRAIPTGMAHGTVTVLSSGEPVEVTTYRIDGEYTDCRRPDSVSFTSSLEADLARRDFTINAMAYSPKRGLIDPFGGRDDLSARLIRCVGEPEKRFSEDALRILRAVRFASVLAFGTEPGFELETRTANAALELCGLLSRISRERVSAELVKLLHGGHAPAVIRQYEPILREVIPLADCADTVGRLNEMGAETPLLLAAALFGRQDAREILRELRFDRKTIRRVGEILSRPGAKDYPGAKLLCAEVGADIARDIETLAAARGDIPAECAGFVGEILRRGECISLKQLRIDGEGLLSLGVEPGRIGGALNRLLREVIEGNLQNERSSLADYAAKHLL